MSQNLLLLPGRRFQLNACLGNNGGPYDYAHYASGYFVAAERLMESLVENTQHVDAMIYPIVFNFRHAVELSLKHLGQVLPRLWHENEPTKFTHRLSDNWAIVRSYLTREPQFDDGLAIARMSAIVDDFVQMDPTGQAFRYPVGKDGQHFLLSHSIINIESVFDVMQEAKEILEGWDFIANYLWDAMCESACYWRE